jgi:glycerol-3-phosphate O-acyltransferase
VERHEQVPGTEGEVQLPFQLRPTEQPQTLDRVDARAAHRVHARGVLASLAEPYLEGYLVAARVASSLFDGLAVSRDEMTERFLSEGEQMLSDGTIRREESVSRVLFKNALKRFRTMGFVAEERTFDDGKEIATISRGPRFDELGALDERLVAYL